MERMTRTFIIVAGWGFIITAMFGMFFPEQFTGLADIQLTSTSSLNEIRANYGGMHLLMGLYVLYLGLKRGETQTALWITGLFCSGYVAGRLISMGVDGMPNDVIFFYIAIEFIGALGAYGILLARHCRLSTPTAEMH